MIRRVFGALACLIAFAGAFILVKELKNSWFTSTSMQEASKTVSATADKEIRLAQRQATDSKSTTEVLAAKGKQEMESTLNAIKTDEERFAAASNFFFGAYFLNTRTRVDYCASLGVNISAFVAAYKQKHHDLFVSAERYQIVDFNEHGYTYDVDKFYKMMLPTLEKYLNQDMKDISSTLKTPEREVCTWLEQNASKWADEMDYRKRAPEVTQLLLHTN